MAGDTFRECTLDDIADFCNGKSLPSDRYSPFGRHPVFGANGQIARTDELLNREPVVVIGRVGAYCGSVHHVNKPSWVTDNAIVATAKPSVDFRFLFYRLKSLELRRTAIGSAQPLMTQGGLKVVSTVVPTLPEQKAIAHILGTLDDKIEVNRRMNETLEAMARAIFKSWFVDFDPVRAKAEGKLPSPSGRGAGGEGLSALPKPIADLFPNSFEDSELGKIPKGWRATTLGACIGFRSGFSFKSQDWQEAGVPVVKIGSVKPGIIDLTQVSYVSEDIARQAARYRLSTGDMLIGMTGYVGEVGLVPPSDSPPLLNQRVGKFVMPKPGTESLAFWYCTTRQPEFRAFVEARSHGTAQANVSGEAIMEFPLVAPTAGILDAFNRTCQPLIDRILSNYAESHALAAIRDALLPKLLSGEIRVGDAERIIGENV